MKCPLLLRLVVTFLSGDETIKNEPPMKATEQCFAVVLLFVSMPYGSLTGSDEVCPFK